MIIARAPLRICLGGGGTDLPFYSLNHSGFLITAAIDKYIYVSLNKNLSGSTVLRHEEIEQVDSNGKLEHGIVRETLNYFKVTEPLNITISSSVPSGTGMGSSSSLTVAIIKALLEFKGGGEKYGPHDIAQLAYHIERTILGEEGGKQDQFIAAYGGIIEMTLPKDGSVLIKKLEIARETIKKLEEKLVLFYLGVSRSSSEIQKKVTQEAKIAQLHYIKELGVKLRNALTAGNLSEVGLNWHQHWLAKKKLTADITNSLIDNIYNLAIKNGALGGKVIGAGGGGFVIFYTEEKAKLIKILEEKGLKYLKFSFSQGGVEIFYKD